ncbi:MAG: FtsX-like permease family protein [Bacteroidetes bacterium]|jgi:putative ABC transport system permease protein|nr:FtsX-like permease family protein [Bacteroidota bacterium]
MIKNYFKIALRNLFKYKVYSFINIFGLAVGIACCLLIGLYVQNEWSYDTFHSESDRIYRAWTEETMHDGRTLLNTSSPIPLRQALEEYIPEIEKSTYIFRFKNLVQTAESPDQQDEQMLVVHNDFFDIFDFELISGDRETLFQNPSSVVLSEETAERFFGTDDPLQQILSIRIDDEFQNFTVTGILENAPANSSLEYSILLPNENLDQLVGERSFNSWFNIFGPTYVLLDENAEPAALNAKFQSMMQTVLGEELQSETNYSIGLQPLTDIHLNTDFPPNIASVSDPAYSYVLAAIAILILFIACVNFMTLSISKSASRAREVGIRKTIGAIRQHLMAQFWGEALMMTVLAIAVGVAFSELLLPLFNDLSGTTLEFNLTLTTIGILAGLAIVISLIAGIYPALILSGFRPVEVLKGRLSLSADKSFFRQSMVVLQFSLSIALIFGTITVHQQLDFMQNKNLGYQKDQVVVVESGLSAGPSVPMEELMQNSYQMRDLLTNETAGTQGISSISASTFSPVQSNGWFRIGFNDNQGQQRNMHANVVDANFISTLGIEVIQGRNFSNENPFDERRAMIVNQALVETFGWENPIGQRLPGAEFIDHEVIGVVEDFHYESLHTEIDPLAMTINPEIIFSGINNIMLSNSPSPRFSFKLDTGNLSSTMASIQNAWESISPGTPFNFTFVDQSLDAQYRQEQQLSRIVTTGSIFAIIIACLGLFGLASLMVIRRTKEIGVRKVLGATSSSIVLLVNKEFTKLVVIAFLIAVPVAWYFMSSWLQNFAYRIDIGLGIIILAGISALVVAWFTVSYQSVKATLVNPVDSLRSE